MSVELESTLTSGDIESSLVKVERLFYTITRASAEDEGIGYSMERRLVTLKLYLDELGVSSNIDTVADRKRVQKAVYLGQLAGVDLGYRFGWYLLGPYSSPLTKDYYALADALAAGEDEFKDKSLRKDVRANLSIIRPLLQPPANIPLNQEDWLELVASYHYLRAVQRRDDEEARDLLRLQKPALFPFTDDAARCLIKTGLLEA